MSREVRRVPIDFDWPMNKVWAGYIAPDRLKRKPCPDCENGWTPACEWLRTFCHRVQMLGSDLRDQQDGRQMHPYLTQDPDPHTTRGQYDTSTGRWAELPRIIRPSADILPLLAGLTDRPQEHLLHPFAGDHSYSILMKLVAAAGLDPDTWGLCATCNGEAHLDAYDGQSADIAAWTPTDPPTGDGWQLWETVTEGSPISPVCATADELADWMSHPERGDRWVPQETAARFIANGWAPTAASSPVGIVSGVEWVGHRTEAEGDDA